MYILNVINCFIRLFDDEKNLVYTVYINVGRKSSTCCSSLFSAKIIIIYKRFPFVYMYIFTVNPRVLSQYKDRVYYMQSLYDVFICSDEGELTNIIPIKTAEDELCQYIYKNTLRQKRYTCTI